LRLQTVIIKAIVRLFHFSRVDIQVICLSIISYITAWSIKLLSQNTDYTRLIFFSFSQPGVYTSPLVKDGKLVTYQYEDSKTLYESFQRGLKLSGRLFVNTNKNINMIDVTVC